MRNAADFTSLFQLAVALNLGYGALLAFGEPIKQRIFRALSECEIFLKDLIDESNQTPEEVDSLYKLGCLYLNLRRSYNESAQQWSALDGHLFHVLIIFCAVLSFAGLVFCSVAPQFDVHTAFLMSALLLNTTPIIIAVTHIILSMRLRSSVYPMLVDFQTMLRLTYMHISESKPTSANSHSLTAQMCAMTWRI